MFPSNHTAPETPKFIEFMFSSSLIFSFHLRLYLPAFATRSAVIEETPFPGTNLQVGQVNQRPRVRPVIKLTVDVLESEWYWENLRDTTWIQMVLRLMVLLKIFDKHYQRRMQGGKDAVKFKWILVSVKIYIGFLLASKWWIFSSWRTSIEVTTASLLPIRTMSTSTTSRTAASEEDKAQLVLAI